MILLSCFGLVGCNESMNINQQNFLVTKPQQLIVNSNSFLNGQLQILSKTANSANFTVVTSPTNGSLAYTVDGVFTYTPNANYLGPDSFSYKARSGKQESSVSRVSFLVVSPGPNGPTTFDITTPAFGQDTPSVITLTYTDSTNDAATNCAVSTLVNLTVVTPCVCLVGICSVEVLGTPSYVGAASFDYTVDAGGETSNASTATSSIFDVNFPPALTSIATLSGASESTAFTISHSALVAASDASDVDADPISFKIETVSGTLTKAGTLVTPGVTLIESGDSVVWTPAPGVTGAQPAFSVRAFDGLLESSLPVFVTVTVAPGPITLLVFTPPANGYYKAGTNLDFSLTYNRPNAYAPNNTMPFTMGASPTLYYATFNSQSGSTYTYRYTVLAFQNASTGLSVAIAKATLGFTEPAALTSVFVDTSNPALLSLTNDPLPRKSKTWNWNCTDVCTYRFAIDTSLTWTPAGTFATAVTATQNTGNGTYYLHVQAQDRAGNLSAVITVSALIDNTVPTAPTFLAMHYPSTASGYSKRPSVKVSGAALGDSMNLYTMNDCSLPSFVGTDVAYGTQAIVMTNRLNLGAHEFYARSVDRAGNESTCSVAKADFLVTAMITGDYPVRSYATGSNAVHVYAADLNNDGHTDFISTDLNANQVRIRFNNGAGIFGDPVTYATGNYPTSSYAADLNGDGFRDLMTTDPTPQVTIRINDGTGVFGTAVTYATGTNPYSVFATDFNNDGSNDLITADYGSNQVSVRFNNGSGVFGNATVYPTASSPSNVYAADLNNDGFKDIMTADYNGSQVSVRLNNGSGGFGARVPYITGSQPNSVYATDLNGDGFRDLLSSDYGSSRVTMRLNNGTGAFGIATNIPVGAFPVAVHANDINGDGFQDIVTADSGPSPLSVRYNNGSAVFGTAVTYATQGTVKGVFTADLNSDGRVDILTVGSNLVSVRMNSSSGVIATAPTYTTASSSPYSIEAADLDGNGSLDFVTADQGLNQLSVRFNDGTGVYGAAVTYSTGSSPVDVALSDLNNDGNKDLVSADSSANQLSVRFNNGSGVFSAPTVYPTGNYPISVCAADLNGDGYNDLISADYSSSQISIRFNNGSGVFGAASTVSTGSNIYSITAADMDNDGHIDIIHTDYNLNRFVVRYNNGSGSFTGNWGNYSTGNGPMDVSVADLNGDGYKDVMTAEYGTYQASVRLNNGSGGFGAQATYATGSNTYTVTSADMNNDGSNDLLAGIHGVIFLRLNNGSGVFGPAINYVTTAAVVRLVAADVNGDGIKDILSANQNTHNTSVLIWKPQ